MSIYLGSFTEKVTRVEVINHTKGGNGREYVLRQEDIDVKLHLQDDERTLKVIISDKAPSKGKEG